MRDFPFDTIIYHLVYSSSLEILLRFFLSERMDDVPLFDLPLTIQENVQQQILEGEEN